MPRPLRVFLCHASQDKPAVRKLHRYLKQHGIEPWLDEIDLLPGENWEVEIPRAIDDSDVILVCLSKNSINKEGYVQKEISFALDKALEKPDGTIFIIPAKLEDCEVPKRLSRFQWVDLFRLDSNKRLLLGLNKRALSLGSDVSPVILEDTRQRKPITKPIESDPVDRDAIEKTQRETAEKLAQEKAALEKEKQEREQVQPPVGRVSNPTIKTDEKASRAASPTYEDVPAHVTERKPFKKTLDPSSLKPDSKIPRKPASYNNLSLLGIGGIFLGVSLFVWMFGSNYIDNNSLVTETPTITFSATLKPATPTQTPPPVTSTFTLSPTITPTPGIISTILGEDGMVLVYVPEGEFTMGSYTYPDEQPIHQVNLDAYWIDQTEVTNAMYANCVEDGGCATSPSFSRSSTRDSYYGNSEFDDYPVIYVDWDQANAYCSWAGRELPTEAQWEKAARGTNRSIYPWGDDTPGIKFLNYSSAIGDTTEVGKYPRGASVYGALDMAGNVWEWVSSLFQNYPYDENDGREDLTTSGSRVLRGGAWNNFGSNISSSYRYPADPRFVDGNLGFRCAFSP